MAAMKAHTRLVHTLVYWLRLSRLLVWLKRLHPFFGKFIPLPSFFPSPTYYTVRRNGAVFRLDVSDFMQWHIFADLEDDSWQQAALHLQSNALVVDVGANVGAFSLKLAQQIVQNQTITVCHIIAFEPNPVIFERLAANLQLNSAALQAVVQLERLALGHQTGEMAFVFSPTNSGGGRLSNQGEVKVKTERFDDYWLRIGKPMVCFMKIDVEGFEPFVIEGAAQCLTTCRPVLYIEMTEQWFQSQGRSSAEILTLLDQLSYEYTLPSPVPAQYNLLAIPRKGK